MSARPPLAPARQVVALVALRWHMVRSARTRRGLAVLASVLPLMLVAAATAHAYLPKSTRFNLSILAPTALAAFALLSVATPLTSGGGGELFPEEQLSAYPIHPVTTYLSGIAVLPLNLAWVTQLVVVTGETSVVSQGRLGLLLALLTALAYVTLITTAGQAAGWLVVAVRRTRRGRLGVWAASVAGAVLVVVAIRSGQALHLLDVYNPAKPVVNTQIYGSHGHLLWWLRGTASLAGLAVLTTVVGRRACAWALRRPGDAGTARESRQHQRRAPRRSLLAELVSVDRASVWRSASLRRGVLVLALLPGMVAAAAGAEWPDLVILPGLVCAGAGLLFGVNMFCLDGSGSIFLAASPHDPGLTIRAKTRVVTETCLVCAGLAVAAGVARTTRPPTGAEATALVSAVVTSTLVVVAACLRTSLRSPHRADLRGPRDTPAPPGAMAVASMRFAASMTVLGLVLSGASRLDSWVLPPLLALPVCLLALRRVLAGWRMWDDVGVRSRVVATVSAG